MKVESLLWQDEQSCFLPADGALCSSAQLVLVFGALSALQQGEALRQLKKLYPNAVLVGCSTAGEIVGARVFDGTVSATAVYFEHTRVQMKSLPVNRAQSFEVGQRLTEGFEKDALTHLLVLSDGLRINGSELVRGITSCLPKEVTVTGGLAGDGERFQETVVVTEDGPLPEHVAVVGFYGDRLHVGCGSLGGWEPFGPERLITRSRGNVLYELDEQPALELYKLYLGEHAQGLPATGLLFPLSFRETPDSTPIVRTILAIDEDEGSLTFAGNIPQGVSARLMRTNFERLIDGAFEAANASKRGIFPDSTPDLAILISCVGRKLILKQRVEEEIEAVRDVLSEQTVMTGFYSYGEISPFSLGTPCSLHNQTMTVATFYEK